MADVKQNLDTEHEHFEAQKGKYQLWSDLYVGEDAVEGNRSYLTQHNLETERQYKLRLERACYRNYAKPVVGVYNTHVWRKNPTREFQSKDLDEWQTDVDLTGQNTDTFFSGVTRQALYQGISFVLVDTPAIGQDLVKTKRDEKALALRPYFVRLDPSDVIDWAYIRQPNGTMLLDYVVIKQRVEQEAQPFMGHQYKDQWFMYGRRSFQIWEKEKAEGESRPILVVEKANPLGEVPIVPFYAEKVHPMVGRSILADIASLCLRIYRKESERDTCEFYTAIPIWFFKGFTPEELTNISLSSSNGITSNRQDSAIEILEAKGTALGSIRQSIQDDHEAILEIALRMTRPDSKVAETAEAKKIDKVQLDTQLARCALDWGEAERRCWELAAKWAGYESESEITYNTDFDVADVQADLLKVFMELKGNGDISRSTFYKLLKDWEILPNDFDEQEEAALIENDNRGAQSGALAESLAAITGQSLTA